MWCWLPRAGAKPALVDGMRRITFDFLYPPFAGADGYPTTGHAHRAYRVVPGVDPRAEVLGRHHMGDQMLDRMLDRFSQVEPSADAYGACTHQLEEVSAFNVRHYSSLTCDRSSSPFRALPDSVYGS